MLSWYQPRLDRPVQSDVATREQVASLSIGEAAVLHVMVGIEGEGITASGGKPTGGDGSH